MTQRPSPFARSALERAVPRYTSYPTAPQFKAGFEPGAYARWLGEIRPEATLSLYLHIPFCDQLCWFCACRTQGAKRYAPLVRYLDLLEREIAMVAEHLGPDRRIVQMHWGGGSPTILKPEDMARLHATMAAHFPGVDGASFAVEIDPRDMTEARLDALAAAGMTRASIGVQDFDIAVQKAIGRMQGHELTRDVMIGLRARGVDSVNVDFLYGLPHQTQASLARTIEQVLELRPDRLALFGYAHVPWMAKRQKMIPEAALPGTEERRAQAALARRLLIEAGYRPIGIDHFALPGDSLAEAAEARTMRRNFQGYTVDHADALIGMGASAIGSLPQGYVQNDPVTASWQLRVEAGKLPVAKNIALTLEDRIRRDVIEQILCFFSLDLSRIERAYGDFARPIAETAATLVEAAPEGALTPWGGGFVIAEAWHAHARLIAAEFDAYLPGSAARHSLAV
jgi:oxygen-independent coproporphyrinogen III oxidase